MLKGSKASDETRKKLSLARKGKKGKKQSQEHRENLSKALKLTYLNGRVHARGNLGKKHSPETKLKMRLAGLGRKQTPEHVRLAKTNRPCMKGIHFPHLQGANCNGKNWIADRTKLAVLSNGEEYRNSPASRDWSRNVKNRDGWKCKIGNDDCSGRLESHHILGWKDHPELRYQINNGITLCHAHHPTTREKELQLSPFFQDLVLEQAPDYY